MAECSIDMFEARTENLVADFNTKQYGHKEFCFVDTIHHRFICHICDKLMKDPALMVCCGMKYCASCLEKWFNTKGSFSCPQCRSTNNYIIEKGMKKEIESLYIRCPNLHKGCEWSGELGDLEVLRRHIKICEKTSVSKTTSTHDDTCKAQEQIYILKSCSKFVASHPYGDIQYDFVEAIHERFICSICTKAMKDPHLMVCCGHKCCAICMDEWLLLSPPPSSCPYCQLPAKHVVEKGMKSEIESLHILCPYQYKGCEWIGEIRNLQDHWMLESGCGYSEMRCSHCDSVCAIKALSKHEQICEKAPVDCPNGCGEYKILRCEVNLHKHSCKYEVLSCKNGCKERIKRQDMEDHLKNGCELRPQQCFHCDFICIAKEYSLHESDCKMFPINCPNNCGKKGITRGTLLSHKKICVLERVACDQRTSGCKARVRRQEMRHHIDHFCKATPKQCEYCGKKTNAKDYSAHMHVCMKFPVNCPNLCHESGIVREKLYSHKKSCKLELIPCSHINGGCSEIIKRQDMEEHLRSTCRKTKTECPYCGSTYPENCFLTHKTTCEKLRAEHPRRYALTETNHGNMQNHSSDRNLGEPSVAFSNRESEAENPEHEPLWIEIQCPFCQIYYSKEEMLHHHNTNHMNDPDISGTLLMVGNRNGVIDFQPSYWKYRIRKWSYKIFRSAIATICIITVMYLVRSYLGLPKK